MRKITTFFSIKAPYLISGVKCCFNDGEEINVSGLENGVYLLQSTLENGTVMSTKFFINK